MFVVFPLASDLKELELMRERCIAIVGFPYRNFERPRSRSFRTENRRISAVARYEQKFELSTLPLGSIISD